jgi:hypothetical protein
MPRNARSAFSRVTRSSSTRRHHRSRTATTPTGTGLPKQTHHSSSSLHGNVSTTVRLAPCPTRSWPTRAVGPASAAGTGPARRTNLVVTTHRWRYEIATAALVPSVRFVGHPEGAVQHGDQAPGVVAVRVQRQQVPFRAWSTPSRSVITDANEDDITASSTTLSDERGKAARSFGHVFNGVRIKRTSHFCRAVAASHQRCASDILVALRGTPQEASAVAEPGTTLIPPGEATPLPDGKCERVPQPHFNTSLTCRNRESPTQHAFVDVSLPQFR